MVAILSVSGESLGRCDTVVRAMRELGLTGDVTKNMSIGPTGEVERGCRVVVANDTRASAELLWNKLQREHGLTCAHVTGFDLVYGCVFDAFAPSRCPSSAKCAP